MFFTVCFKSCKVVVAMLIIAVFILLFSWQHLIMPEKLKADGYRPEIPLYQNKGEGKYRRRDLFENTIRHESNRDSIAVIRKQVERHEELMKSQN